MFRAYLVVMSILVFQEYVEAVPEVHEKKGGSKHVAPVELELNKHVNPEFPTKKDADADAKTKGSPSSWLIVEAIVVSDQAPTRGLVICHAAGTIFAYTADGIGTKVGNPESYIIKNPKNEADFLSYGGALTWAKSSKVENLSIQAHQTNPHENDDIVPLSKD